MSDRLRLVVLGMMGAYPYGGQSWLYLNWLSGFKRLGHDVYYVEDHDLWPFDPTKDAVVDDWTYGVAHVESCCSRLGLADKWAVRSARQAETWGMSEADLKDLYASCDILL